MSGGDTVAYAASDAGVELNLSVTTGGYSVGVGGHAEGDKVKGVENISGSKHDDKLTGSTGANAIMGMMGADLLDGRAGRDLLEGGAGNDTLHGREGDDTLQGGDGDDLLEGGSGSDVIKGGNADGTDDGIDTVTYIDIQQGDLGVNVALEPGKIVGDTVHGSARIGAIGS